MSIRILPKTLAFSSSWLGKDHAHSKEIIKSARTFGLNQIQIGADLNAEPPMKLAAALSQEKMSVVSVRNVLSCFGGPDEHIDGFNLGSPDLRERKTSYYYALETAKAAKSLGSNRIILRLGHIYNEEAKALHEKCLTLYPDNSDTDDFKSCLLKGKALVAKFQEAYTDRIIRILYSLLKAEPEISFCIENRAAFFEVPSPKSLEYIFEDLKSDRLKYWHHSGNAHIQEKLGLVDVGELLSKFAYKLEGVSLHDVIGLETHLPPGTGELDFKALKDALPSDAVQVLDLGASTSIDDFVLGLHEIRGFGF